MPCRGKDSFWAKIAALAFASRHGACELRVPEVRVQRGLPSAAGEPVALTIGNFDGVHRGHQAMLTRLIEAAEDLRLPPAVLTFDPHPREFFSPATAPPRLSTLRSKLDLFRAYG